MSFTPSGDVTKHLGYLGVRFSFQQAAIEEFDYAVTQLSADLKDGIRLCRLAELLTGKSALSLVLVSDETTRQKVWSLV